MTTPFSSFAKTEKPSEPRLQAALFDVDGTLADTDVFHYQVFRDMFARHQVMPADQFDKQFFATRVSGRANALIAAEFFPQLSLEEQTALLVQKEADFRIVAEAHLQPLPGLIAFLEALRAAHIPIAAVTNAPRVNAEMMLRVIHAAPHFDHVVLGEECKEAKPSPVPYLVGIERCTGPSQSLIDPSRCIVFEDSLPGVAAGVASGAIVVGVRTTQDDATLRKAGASYTIADFTEIDAQKLIRELKDFVIAPTTQEAP